MDGIDQLEAKVNVLLEKELTKLENLNYNELLLQQIAINRQIAKQRGISNKTLLENFYQKYKLGRVHYDVNKQTIDDSLVVNIRIPCPKTLQCKHQYIGIGIKDPPLAGTGDGKKEAEEIAAKQALHYLTNMLI